MDSPGPESQLPRAGSRTWNRQNALKACSIAIVMTGEPPMGGAPSGPARIMETPTLQLV